MKFGDDDLKLIFVHKIGYNSKNEGLFEFMFSCNETNIDMEGWCWDKSPACDNAFPPTDDYIDEVFNLKTKSFDLYCLHESVERPYMHGYHTIHALAYEVEKQDDDGFNDYEKLMENDNNDLPLLVFHYGMTLANIKDLLRTRNIILKNDAFVETSSIMF